MFLYEKEHLDDAPALVFDLLSTVHENRPLESGRDPSLEAFRRERGEKNPSPYWEDNGFCGLGGVGGGNSPKDLGISLIRGFSGNKSTGMKSQPPLNECTVI